MILVLLVIAFVCFVAAAFNPPSPINLVAAGLAFVVGAQLAGAHLL